MLVIVKPLLVEHMVAVLALNHWICRMMLSLMVDQTCLGQGLEGAARVVAVQSSLRVDESLLAMTLLIFTTLFIVFCFYIETLYTALDGGVPRATLLGMLSSGFRHVTLFKVTGHNVIPLSLLFSSRMLATNEGTHEKLPR